MAVEELTSDPAGNTLRAALGLIPRGRRTALPSLELIRRGVAIDRDHLARYDQVCGFRLSDTVPATYPHVLAFPLAMRLLTAPDFPFPAIGLVHIANRITVFRPVPADDILDFTVRAADLRPHSRGQQVDVVVSASVAGVPVWSAVSTYLSRAGDSSRSGRPSPASSPSAALSPASAPSPSPASAVWRVPAGVGSSYAGVSGDRNPIHTSRIGARLFGFPRPIAHGMWSLARCLAFFEGRLPAAYTVEVSFKQPILLPSTVSFHASPSRQFELYGKRPHLAGQVTPG
ncbi:MaoC family dehydratase [Paractinoplanes atraurantiacus]|uniref:MaoC like domain-containing protein n=1 Tax=Paractinoplanes atraurantiacus TaxID=1036182 RepID=A0A285IYY0_9ACTN|nr:MaoC/PaaZ C-terminal domain-containing protein [Actinoplanes atraurantiacus]SNY53168.1 MaoC like domain-containing protein [Actinoplanes atraurantiacus]